MFSKRRLTLLPLTCAMYLVVSGGPYGIEDAVASAGPRLTLLLCIFVPITLSLPTALMAAELTSLLPAEGGFYFWVKEALGSFAGFAEVYLTILYTAVDTAIYPVLFVTYSGYLFPMSSAAQVGLAIAAVWLCGFLNVIGVRLVGYTSTLLTACSAGPFVALVALGLPRLLHWHLPPEAMSQNLIRHLGGALVVVIWNFCGWENLSVVSAEIENPQRNYIRALAITLPAVTLGYLLPLAVCLQGTTGPAWYTGAFAERAVSIGGHLLGTAVAVGAALSSFAMFDAGMLWVSRLPFVLARENYLPASLAAVSSRDVPVRSLLVCCAIFTLLTPLGFFTLVVFDVFFYMLALALEMMALIRLRRIYPERSGLFTIGGGRVAVYLVALAPLCTWFASFGLAVSSHAEDLMIAAVLTAFVWPIYTLLGKRYGGPTKSCTGRIRTFLTS
jgi:amino acid transporter